MKKRVAKRFLQAKTLKFDLKMYAYTNKHLGSTPSNVRTMDSLTIKEINQKIDFFLKMRNFILSPPLRGRYREPTVSASKNNCNSVTVGIPDIESSCQKYTLENYYENQGIAIYISSNDLTPKDLKKLLSLGLELEGKLRKANIKIKDNIKDNSF